MIPFNTWLILLLGALALNTAARFALGTMNSRSLKEHGREIPAGFEGEIDATTLSRITDYTLESSRFSAFEGLFDDLMLVAVILSGLIPWFAGLLAANLGFVPAGLAFYGALFLLSAVLDIPFGVYSTFIIEKKHGFSTITFSTWVADLLKGAALSIVLVGILLAVFLFLLESTSLWWLWAWAFFSAFQALMLWLYPVVIAPLFNKFEPLADEGLKEQIVGLMGKKGLEIEGVFQIDAGKRSRHTNAYFTGIGRAKRIVLFDTLLESHTADEVLAVLAHELGHWRRRHVIKQLVLMACVSLLVLYVTAWLMRLDQFYFAFGFKEAVPFAGLFFAGVILKPLAFFFTPLGTGLSRRFERQADADACELAANPRALAAAFKRLAKDNLANLHPHPLYTWFYYSHPPLVERVRSIEACAEKAP